MTRSETQERACKLRSYSLISLRSSLNFSSNPIPSPNDFNVPWHALSSVMIGDLVSIRFPLPKVALVDTTLRCLFCFWFGIFFLRPIFPLLNVNTSEKFHPVYFRGVFQHPSGRPSWTQSTTELAEEEYAAEKKTDFARQCISIRNSALPPFEWATNPKNIDSNLRRKTGERAKKEEKK